MKTLDDAISAAGSMRLLAERVGVSPQAISLAKSKGVCSPELAEKIEKALRGRIRREVLVWPGYNPVTRQTAAAK